MSQKGNHFDYIICGGGMSGLSLAYLLSKSKLSSKNILIIDPEKKTKNDRTWAFWEKETSTFEDILFRKWEKVNFITLQNQKKLLDIAPYKYKLLRGIDFYNHIYSRLSQFTNFTFLYDSAVNISSQNNIANVITLAGNKYTAEYIFDSTFKLNLENSNNINLIQHFMGWVIETEIESFDTEVPNLMDFSIPQKNGDCVFVYILPFSKTRALVEYTVFSEDLYKKNEYINSLENYIKDKIGISDYKIIETEFGIIPMSNVRINEFPSHRIIRIGISGGRTNPSTGYTFSNTQKRLIQIIEKLEKGENPLVIENWKNKRHLLYTSTLLNVLKNKRHLLGDVFNLLFSKNSPSRVFKFLDGETTFLEELRIMWSTPKNIFARAFLQEIKKKKNES